MKHSSPAADEQLHDKTKTRAFTRPGPHSLRPQAIAPRRTSGHSPARRPLPIGRLLAGNVPDRGMGPAQVAVLILNTTPIQKQEKAQHADCVPDPSAKPAGAGPGNPTPAPPLSASPPNRNGEARQTVIHHGCSRQPSLPAGAHTRHLPRAACSPQLLARKKSALSASAGQSARYLRAVAESRPAVGPMYGESPSDKAVPDALFLVASCSPGERSGGYALKWKRWGAPGTRQDW